MRLVFSITIDTDDDQAATRLLGALKDAGLVCRQSPGSMPTS